MCVCLLCPTLCNPVDCSPPGPSVHGILQARTVEWVATSPKGTIERKKVKSLSHVRLFATPWTVASQAHPSMEFSRQEYWSGLPFPSPGRFAVVLHIYFGLVACAFGVYSKKLIAKTKVKEVSPYVSY